MSRDAISQLSQQDAAWLFEQRAANAASTQVPQSDALERHRAARADLLELDLQRARKEVVEAAQVGIAFGVLRSYLVRASRILHARFGEDAFDILATAMRDMSEYCDTIVQEPSNAGQ